VTKRATLEALARALKVSPDELTGKPYTPHDPLTSEAYAGIAAVEAALDRYDLGIDPGMSPRPWPELTAALTVSIRESHERVLIDTPSSLGCNRFRCVVG
jgi:hypothetical protein